MALNIQLRGPVGFNIALSLTSYTLTADGGSITLTGTSASLEYGREVVGASGSYAVTGTAATLTYTPATRPWVPTDLPDLLVWLNVRDGDADITYGTGSDVATWGSHSTTTYDATTLDTADRPVYSATGLEGSLPCVDFARNVDKLLLDIHGSNTTSNIFNQPYSFGMVIQSTFTGDFLSPLVSYDDLSSDTDTIAPLVRSVFGSGQDMWIGRAANAGTGTSTIQWPSNNTTAMIAVTSSAAGISGGSVTADFTVNGSATVSIGPVTGFGTPSKRGILLGYPDWDIGGGCKFGEFVFCDAALSTDDRQKLEGYLAWNWGYESKLPVSHPYKSAAPTVALGGDFTITAELGTYTLTGTASSLEFGREVIASAGAYTYTGTAASLEYGREVIALGGSYAVTGTAATLLAARKIVAAAGGYSVTGTAASLEFGREVIALGGSYALTGTAASLEYGREVLAVGGTYALTGAAATLSVDRMILATGGTYTLTGTAATFVRGRRITADGSSYALSGTAGTFDVARLILAAGGTYTITGTAANLRATRRVTAAGGAYSLTGTDATLIKTGNYAVNAETGSYVLTGIAASLVGVRLILAEQGALSLTGSDVTLVYEANPEPEAPPDPAGWQGPSRKMRKALRKSRKKGRRDEPPEPTQEPAPEPEPPPFLPSPTAASLLDGIGTPVEIEDPAAIEAQRAADRARWAARRAELIAERDARIAEQQRLAYEAMILADDEEAMAALLLDM